MTISELSHKCEQLLELACVSQNRGDQTSQLARPDNHDGLKREQGRFKVWASNLGALQESSSGSSLDSRLQAAPKARAAIINVLEGLVEAVETVIAISKGELPNRDAPAEMMDEVGLGGATTEMDELRLDIRSSITDLFRYSVLLRRHNPRGREKPSGNNAPEADSSLDVRHAIDMFPKTRERPWLAERLGNANAKRREYIQFRQKHQQRSQPKQLNTQPQPLADSPAGDYVSTKATTKATTYREPDGSVILPDEVPGGSNRSMTTTGTSFLVIEGDDGADEPGILDLERITFKGIELKFGDFIECPLCRTIQNFRKDSDWRFVSSRCEWTLLLLTGDIELRRHVFADLQPYVCAFEGCSAPLFNTRREWFRHEMELHRREWHCPKCDAITNCQAELRAHLESSHAREMGKTRIEPMLNLTDRPIQHFGHDSCLLCDNWNPDPNETGSNALNFCKHVARHYQQLALSAIPVHIEGLEIKESSEIATEGFGGNLEMDLGETNTMPLVQLTRLTEMDPHSAALKQAEDLLIEKMTSMRQETQSAGRLHPSLLETTTMLSAIYQHKKLWAEAERVELEFLDDLRGIRPLSYHDFVKIVDSLAHLSEKQGRLVDAERWVRQALSTRQKVLGPKHPDSLLNMERLVHLCQEMDRLEEAESLQRQVLETRESVLGLEHPDTLSSMERLSRLCQKAGKLGETEELRARALARISSTQKPDSLETLLGMEKMALRCQEAGSLEEAEKLLKKVVQIRSWAQGPSHRDLWDLKEALASCYYDTSQLEQAAELEIEVLTAKRREWGDCADIIPHTRRLATLYWTIGKREEAEMFAKEAWHLSFRFHGANNLITMECQRLLASTYEGLGRFDNAEFHARAAFTASKALQGPEHPDTLEIMGMLAKILYVAGHPGEGIEVLEVCVDIGAEKLGPEDPRGKSHRALLERWKKAA